MARLFVAVWPPDDVVAELAALPRPDQPGLRWTTPDQWHEKMLRRFVDRRRDDPRMTREPPHMMVRAIEWYLGEL